MKTTTLFLVVCILLLGIILFLSYLNFIHRKPVEKISEIENTTEKKIEIIEKVTEKNISKEEISGAAKINEVFLYSDRFEPNIINIEYGKPFKIINKDSKSHTLIFEGISIEYNLEPNDYLEYPDTFTKGKIIIVDKDGNFKLTVIIS